MVNTRCLPVCVMRNFWGIERPKTDFFAVDADLSPPFGAIGIHTLEAGFVRLGAFSIPEILGGRANAQIGAAVV